MERVIIGVDPTSCQRRSRSSTATRICSGSAGSPPTRLATPRCGSTSASGRSGSGRSRAAWASAVRWPNLLEAGDRVVDVPAKLAARAQLLDTGHSRKTDAHDAHSVAVAAVRAKNLRVLAPDGQLEALRMLVDHRDQLSSRRVQTVNRLHRLLAELTPGKAKKDLTALQAKAILARVRPRDVAGKTRRQVAADELADLTLSRRRSRH